MDLEMSMMRRLYRTGLVFRTYFGDSKSYFLGWRLEGGPRWGRYGWNIGFDAGFIAIPDVGPKMDMMLFSARLLSGMVRWNHVALIVDAFALDFYIVPANKEINREVQGIIGFNWGLSVAGYF